MAKGNFSKVVISEQGDFDALLRELPVHLAGETLARAVQAAGKPVVAAAKKNVTGPGYKGDKKGLKPLRDTIGMQVRDYGTTWVAIIGPEYPAGAHGHLVEFGHDIVIGGRAARVDAEEASDDNETPKGKRVGRVRPYPFLRPAVDATLNEQQNAFVHSIQTDVASFISIHGKQTRTLTA